MRKMCLVGFIGCVIIARSALCYADDINHPIEVEVITVQEGNPLRDVAVRVGFEQHFGVKPMVGQDAISDTNGIARCSGEASGRITVVAEKDQYYSHFQSIPLLDKLSKEVISTDVTVELKAIKNPVPMYVKWECGNIPATGIAVGYDTNCGDWIAPWGKGKKPYIYFKLEKNMIDSLNYDIDLTVSFPNEHDGIQPFVNGYQGGEGSVLRSNHKAPEFGYNSNLTLSRVCRNGQSKVSTIPSGYYMRLNTVVDKDGKIVSAEYGKLYEGIVFDKFDSLIFTYYHNPDKSRNVESDPERNLLLTTPLWRPSGGHSVTLP